MNKKIVLILLILVSLCAISHACAVEDVACEGADESQNLTVSDEQSVVSEPQILKNSEDAEFVAADSENHDNRIIQEQINNANPGDEITLNGGTYNCDGLVIINKTVTIDGNGSTLIFNGTGKDYTSSFFYINHTAPGVILKNLKFLNGQLFFGGAITWAGDNGSIINCTFKDNEAFGEFSIGGAILILGNNCNVTDCTFTYNKVQKYGGAIFWNGTSGTIRNCEFNDNEVNDIYGDDNGLAGGAALLLRCNGCLVTNCTFSNNRASECGGAISVIGNENNKIINSRFYNNHAEGSNGGGAIFTACESLLINNCTFIGNNATDGPGGAICLSRDTRVSNSFFDSNFAMVDGNGYVYGNDVFYGENASEYQDNIISNTFILDFAEPQQNAIGVTSRDVYEMIISEGQSNTFKETKRNSTVEFGEIGMIFEYGRSGAIKVVVTHGRIENSNIKVLTQDKSKTVNAKITFVNDVLTVSNLPVGNYFLRVTTTPDKNYIEASKELSITVNKATATIIAQKVTVAYKKGSLWTVKIVDTRDNKPVSNMKLTLKVYTGSKFVNVDVYTNSRGEASYQTKGLSAATHKVIVIGTHNGYKLNPITSSIKVVKQTALKIKVKKKTVKVGAVLSITVINKKTKKPVNGIKIQLLIKDGKGYKTVTLKTKKKGKTKGFCGYATNKLGIGNHKVKISPVDIKYSGSASSSMKITKAAKKAPDWETKA